MVALTYAQDSKHENVCHNFKSDDVRDFGGDFRETVGGWDEKLGNDQSGTECDLEDHEIQISGQKRTESSGSEIE